MNVPRPSKDDTEDDLLRYQEEFLRSKTKPSATVVKKPDKRKQDEAASEQGHKDVVKLEGFPDALPSPSVPVKKSKFQQETSNKKQVFQQDDPTLDPEEYLEKHDSHITSILKNIVEKNTLNAME
ncbi:unnamed protein product, partial [Owenia fusiformis]